jgi:autotransporter-associated beta strand protein
MFRQLIARAFETVRHWCPVVGVRSLALATVVAVAAIAAARGQNPLVAHYNFDDSANTYTTGGTIFDVSGNDFNGTVINAALTHNATGGVSGGSMNAVSSGSASFTTSYASSPVAADNFTLMFWVKAGGPSSNSLDFGQINYSNGSSGQLRSTTGQLLYYRHVVTSNQTFQFGPVGGATIVDNSGSGSVWKQIAFMADSATGEYGWYVDGGTPFFSAFPATDNPFTADTTVTGLQMGRSQWAVSRTGQIDEVQLYDRSLTQTEVQLLFANPGYGGTNFRVWEPTAASNSWTAAADWQGLGAAAAPGVTGDPASASADVAILKNYAFSGGLGIDMSAAGADGSLALGGISFNSASGPLRIGNSAADTTGTLRLNGGLVDSVANTILKVAGASDLTIGNSASGSGTQTMAVELAKPQNVVDVAASRTLTIESAISQSGGGSLIQKTGSGTLVLSGANTFTGGTTISAGTLEVASIADSGTSNLGTAGSLAIGGGTLRYTGSGAQSTTRDLSIDGVAATIDVVSPTGSLTFSSSGGTRTASLTKAGSGSLAIDGGFSGSAGITVAAGTLALGAHERRRRGHARTGGRSRAAK